MKGVEEEHLLVFRVDDPDVMLQIIDRLAASRDKQIRAEALKLELEWYKIYNDRHRGDSKQAGQEDKRQSPSSGRDRNRKTRNT